MSLPRFRLRTLMIAVAVTGLLIALQNWFLSLNDGDGDIPVEIDIAIYWSLVIVVLSVAVAIRALLLACIRRDRLARTDATRLPCDSPG